MKLFRCSSRRWLSIAGFFLVLMFSTTAAQRIQAQTALGVGVATDPVVEADELDPSEVEPPSDPPPERE